MEESREWKKLPIAGLPYKLSLEYRTGDWRALRPVIDYSKCTSCMLCWLFCPDMAILWDGKKVWINYDYCKGCGICEHECPLGAIRMVPEGGE